MATEKDPLLTKIEKMQSESANLRTYYDERVSRNVRLVKGVPLEDRKTTSDVRKRSKIYFRKIWATRWRLVASFYAAFMRDPQSFLLEGRDTYGDPWKAKLLQTITKYRVDKMTRKNSLFLKHIWAMMEMLDNGIVSGLLTWEYDPELGKDGPVFKIYPFEQVYLDLAADTPEDARWTFFEDFLSKEQLEELGYENLEDAQAEGTPSNQVRSARYEGKQDPLQNPGNNEYPASGRYEGERRDSVRSNIYRVWKVFYKEKGKWKFCITNKGICYLKPPIDSPYGDRVPHVYGTVLTEAHKMIGEGLPEPLEGPQESYNQTLNQRKDNVALLLSRPTIVARYGNVDLNALVNRASGKAILADDPNGVKELEMGDYTGTAHRDAAADDNMMQEMSGVTPSLSGMSDSGSATESNINLSQGSAKIELYLAIGGETYFRSFYSLLAYLVQRFETDETIVMIANDELREQGYMGPNILKFDDFDADVMVNIGMAYAGREQEIRQSLLVLDRGAVYNQTQLALLQTGAVPPQGVEMFNGNEVFRDLLPKLGKKDIQRYFIKIPPPPQPKTPAQELNNAMAGKTAPQVGDMNEMVPQNELQAGSLGGF